MKYLILGTFLVGTAVSPLYAGHANPWADGDDTLNMQYHDANQAKSLDTPGQDEMRGNMVQSAHGKLDETVGKSMPGRAGGATEAGQGKN
ncbi:hypothetical protein AYJ57_17870 [Salipiger sp. CCB-MM3]|uniref:hypothetical protein n=1 Tax=Salipiger sp. CCB-MM3 TaxID=1792508 RepID=UPI00080ABAEF|nr:hypothetical protein [Salipiger sp. CCB-MM3]ANT62291.1 hypothetical protein AYJ57_17870 [Salipiger sp. CCB-MM3]